MLFVAASVASLNIARINQTAFTITTTLHYTGGGTITQFSVSFRLSGESEWNDATIIPARLVPDSDNLQWTGTIASAEFTVYAELEFQVLVTNERNFSTTYDGAPLTEQQG